MSHADEDAESIPEGRDELAPQAKAGTPPNAASTTDDLIEILPVALLTTEAATVSDLRRVSQATNIGFGWHYPLDLPWVLKHARLKPGNRVLDAGAGLGILQWYLSERGVDVLSVDRMPRDAMAVRLRARYKVRGHRSSDLLGIGTALWRETTGRASLRHRVGEPIRVVEGLSRRILQPARGTVTILNQDLSDLSLLRDSSFDAIVSVSSLEHNDPSDLEHVVSELLRVLRPGGRLVATLGAARDADWFHAPSQGWCYTEASLRRIFGLSPAAPSNYDDYDRRFAELRECAELRDNLAPAYFRSGDNGMPWGKWDPQYQSVGVVKVKGR